MNSPARDSATQGSLPQAGYIVPGEAEKAANVIQLMLVSPLGSLRADIGSLLDLRVNVCSEKLWPNSAHTIEDEVRCWAEAVNPDLVLIVGQLSQQERSPSKWIFSCCGPFPRQEHAHEGFSPAMVAYADNSMYLGHPPAVLMYTHIFMYLNITCAPCKLNLILLKFHWPFGSATGPPGVWGVLGVQIGALVSVRDCFVFGLAPDTYS